MENITDKPQSATVVYLYGRLHTQGFMITSSSGGLIVYSSEVRFKALF